LLDLISAKIYRSEVTRVFLFVLAAGLTGCQTANYYKQAIQGQFQVLKNRQPMSELIADPQTPGALKEKFQFVLKLREFAETELKLPVNGHYQSYVDLHRPYVVWNVHAAPEFTLETKTWWYPIVGSLKYRGYFSEADARFYAEKLAAKQLDVYVDGVEAYSTLGWFKDPVLNTFIHHSQPQLAETIFHELAHQRVFIHGDTDFNEAFATTVGQEGVRRWLLASGDSTALESYHVALRRNEQFVQLVQATRRELESLYASATPGRPTNMHSDMAHARQEKEMILEQMRSAYGQLKAQWGGFDGYDNWFAQSLNNAQLNTVATYYNLVPAFQRLLRQNDGDLGKFYRKVTALGKLPKAERHRKLCLWDTGDQALMVPDDPIGQSRFSFSVSATWLRGDEFAPQWVDAN